MGLGGNGDVMTWFPRREDYEDAPAAIQPDETVEEKIQRLCDNVEQNQANIKEIVDGNSVCHEQKIYRTMDIQQDMTDLSALLKECEAMKGAEDNKDGIKKAKIGIINLKAYLDQVDVTEFASAIRNEFQFKVGCNQRFGPWLDWAETAMVDELEKPNSFDHALLVEQQACLFLKDCVKANRSLKFVQTACDGIRGNVKVQDAMAKLSERYYVLCKKSEQRMKNIQHLMIEWKRLEDMLDETDPFKMDEMTPKQMVIFLRTYALYFG